jgi:ribosomal protein L11 methyltransferase
VLSIAAVKLGVPNVVAIDIDPIAAEIARRNCDTNGIGDEVSISAGTLSPDHPGRYELVVSNISTDANIGLAETFGTVVLPGGNLVLSGILETDDQRVIDAMARYGFELVRLDHERDWSLIHLAKR